MEVGLGEAVEGLRELVGVKVGIEEGLEAVV